MTFLYTYNYPQMARDGGFMLRNYKDGPLDWRLIGSVEVERIVREQNFEQIDAVLNHLSEAPLGSILDAHVLDSGVAKYFMLSQFSVQYLLFCRKILEETVADLRESHSNSQVELAAAKRSLSEARNEVVQLHKKLTQMEAIHEVLYPCHLCTKNFVNNDSLNLHISRKHNRNISKPDKKSDIGQPFIKERETDLALINTIKLELEIKHLKERLNSAERQMKEKHIEPDVETSSEKPETQSVHSIGIQSNLSEIKERDDSGPDNEIISSHHRHQMNILLEKLQEFEKWKEDQILQNSEFLNNVNSKIRHISDLLDINRNGSQTEIDDEKKNHLLPSVENLEKVLTEKVEEMGRTTAANLTDIVKNIDITFREKLQIFEEELTKLNKEHTLQRGQTAESTSIKGHRFYKKPVDANKHSQSQPSEIDDSDSESHHTFVKAGNRTHPENSDSKDVQSVDSSDSNVGGCAEFSGSLLDEELLKTTFSDEDGIDKTMMHATKRKKKLLQNEHETKPKPVTRRDAEIIARKRILSLGVDTKAKKLTALLKKRYLEDLNEKRTKLKQKNSQYYVARNKIKKFVEKLCATKMPSNRDSLPKVIDHIQQKNTNGFNDDELSLSEKEEALTFLSESPLSESSNLKQRLQRILASPIRKPDDRVIESIANSEGENKMPIPMPRKRVMFNQHEVQRKYYNHP